MMRSIGAVDVYLGPCVDVMQTMADASVDSCITSPPYFGLRNYGVAGQIGLESTVNEYIDDLAAVFEQVHRILKASGSIWLNIGDSYTHTAGGGYKRKELMGVPWKLAFALQDAGWYLREDIIWSKSNTMPESVKDRCSRSHEFIFHMSKNETYYHDAASIREPVSLSTIARISQNIEGQAGSTRANGGSRANRPMKVVLSNAYELKNGHKPRSEEYNTDDPSRLARDAATGEPRLMRNKRSVWEIGTAGYKGAHFATYPPALIEPCVLAGCPPGGTIIDPFAGSGTTGEVAAKLGRKAILIELNPEYYEMAAERVTTAQIQKSLKF